MIVTSTGIVNGVIQDQFGGHGTHLNETLFKAVTVGQAYREIIKVKNGQAFMAE